jgi:pilus assembly protein CpaE
MVTATGSPETISMNVLSVILLGSNDARRKAVATALAGTQAQLIKEAPLPDLDTLPQLLQGDSDVLIVDLEDDPERGLELVEGACALKPALTVMAYARLTDPDLIVRCMRAGAREFLSEPLSGAAVTDALVHASVRRDEVKRQKKTSGRCLIFAGAKGGSGVTTVASNFAVALTQASNQGVVLLDLDLQLGDAALGLGLSSDFSALDALQNENRLDSDLVSKLLVRHSSGLQVLAGPDDPNDFRPTPSAVVRLVNILREDFAWVVVDAGSRYVGYGNSLFDIADKVYFITQVSVTELRNSNRFISTFFKGDAIKKVEVVLNRYTPRAGEIDQDSIGKALTVSPAWKIPSDYAAAHAAQNTATALVQKDGPVSRMITAMARAACGKGPAEAKKKRFGLFS